MTKELAIRKTTTVMANSPDQLQTLQAPLAGWAREKLEVAKLELAELTQAVAEAKKHKWKTSVLVKAQKRALGTLTFYDKVAAALDSGFMLFPPVPNADVIAVRVDNREPPEPYSSTGKWERSPGGMASEKIPLPRGTGIYVDPVIHWRLVQTFRNEKNEMTGKEWQSLDLGDPIFPLAMAKPAIIAATTSAMEAKFFDEIRMFPFERRPKGDPCLLGSIVEGHGDRRLYFLISWRINKGDI